MPDLTPYDFHIHTKHLGCADETMEISAIVRECARLGVTRLGITDHLNTLEKLDLHREIRRDIEALDTEIEVYFGLELNFTSLDGEFPFSEEIKDQYGFQFAIGGIHCTYLDTYDLSSLVDIQHRHHLKTCYDPLVDVLVHPYWFWKGEFDQNGWPWFDSMRAVPESYARELGQVARETGTAIEINAGSNLTTQSLVRDDRYVQEYIAYLAVIADEGPCFSLGTDAHGLQGLGRIRSAWQVAQQLHLGPERIWLPSGRCMAGGQATPAGDSISR